MIHYILAGTLIITVTVTQKLCFVTFKPGLWRAHAWFLEIVFVHDVGMYRCVCCQGYKLHLHDIEPLQLVEQVCIV